MTSRTAITAGLALALLATAACSSSAEGDGEPGAGLAVVASTDVWGDVVAQVGGDLVEVTSIIDDPSADPHSFEASTRGQLALSRAALVVANGGGYDDFVDTMVGALAAAPPVVHAADVADTGEENEHVWFSLDGVRAVADEVAARLGELDPDNAATYTANAEAFGRQVTGIQEQVAAIRDEHAGATVAMTEPLPVYLIQAAGLTDVTPGEFAEAIEEETDVPPTVMAELLRLVQGGEVDVLLYNEQTTGPQTEQVLAAAQDAGVAVVPVTETLPAGTGYIAWVTGTVEALREALRS